MLETYILVDKIPIIEMEPIEWGIWFQDINNRCVARDILEVEPSEEISTVFLGIDHNFSGGPPLLFETLIRGGDYDGFIFRYVTWQQAEKGHQLIVQARLDGDTPDLET